MSHPTFPATHNDPTQEDLLCWIAGEATVEQSAAIEALLADRPDLLDQVMQLSATWVALNQSVAVGFTAPTPSLVVAPSKASHVSMASWGSILAACAAVGLLIVGWSFQTRPRGDELVSWVVCLDDAATPVETPTVEALEPMADEFGASDVGLEHRSDEPLSWIAFAVHASPSLDPSLEKHSLESGPESHN